MNSLETSHDKRVIRGFTLIEVLLVVALSFLLGGYFLPVGLSFYQSQVLEDAREGLVDRLREAQSLAYTGKHNHAFGIKILSGTYVLFEGVSYEVRDIDADELISVPSRVSFSGLDEITFPRFSAEPNVSGTVTLSLGEREVQIEVSKSGNIE